MILAVLQLCTRLPCGESSMLITRSESQMHFDTLTTDVNANFHSVEMLSAGSANVHNCVSCGILEVDTCSNSSARLIKAATVYAVSAHELIANAINSSISLHSVSPESVNNSVLINISGRGSLLHVRNSVVTCFECFFEQISEITNSRIEVVSNGKFATAIDKIANSVIEYRGKEELCGSISLLESSVLRVIVELEKDMSQNSNGISRI